MNRQFVTFERFAKGTPNLSPAERIELFGRMPEQDQVDSWAKLAEQVDGERLLGWDVILDGPAADIFKRKEPRGDSPQGRTRRRRRNFTTSRSSDPAPGRARTSGADEPDPLLTIPARIYVVALADAPVRGDGGVIRCPLPGHEDRNPSFMVYRGEGWRCFGCGHSGTIYDLARELSGIGDRGADFKALRKWIGEKLLGAAA